MILRLFRFLKRRPLSQDLQKLRGVKFDFLLPIGSSCQTRYQIERFLRKKYGIEQPACFFDWLGLGGVKGVAKIIERDFILESNEFQIKTVYSKNNFAPIHVPSGFRFQHDFGLSVEIRRKKESTMETVVENMEDTLLKYRHIGTRTKQILSSGRCIGLVYRGRIKQEHFVLLEKTLKKKFDSHFFIINILPTGKSQDFIMNEMIINVEIDEKNLSNNIDWRGYDLGWDGILDHIKLKKTIYTGK